MIRAVVFDLGQVLASPPNLYVDAADRLGVSAADYEANYWADRPAYDDGASDAEYWGPLLRTLGLTPTDDDIAEMARLDSELWIQVRPEAHALLRDTRAAGRTVAVLSNAPHAIAAAAEHSAWRADIDRLFISAPMGVSKPEPACFRQVQHELGLDADQIAFIDDRQPNVDGALAVGWHAHLWADDADTRTWLQELGVLQ
ncbi:HAD-IA family hydrolase [Ornithinimicrobium sp. Y1847]|uniref:HAD-IA family hydrolase n=1 Tax=Ornithinimicrobium sp. Y1847 TaxID=3405419 RepID=UPI003B66D4F0